MARKALYNCINIKFNIKNGESVLLAYPSKHSQSTEMQHQTKTENNQQMLLQSDEVLMMQQVQATHAPDGREIDCRALLDIIYKSLYSDQEQSKNFSNQRDLQEELGISADTIQRIYKQILGECWESKDPHVTTISMFSILANYPWDVKLLLALLSLAMNYGEFGLLTINTQSRNPLAVEMANFKQLPRRSNLLEPIFDALDDFIAKNLLPVAKSFIEFRDLLPQYHASADKPSDSIGMDCIATAAYWTIRGVVAGISQIASFSSLYKGKVTSDAEVVKLSGLNQKINMSHDRLKEHLTQKRKGLEVYQANVPLPEKDNTETLRVLISDQLQNVSTGDKVGLDVLRGKSVLLLISGLDLSLEVVLFLKSVYKELQTHPAMTDYNYEIVWRSIVEDTSNTWNEAMKQKFQELQSSMPWYVVQDPLLLEPTSFKRHKDIIHFDKNPMLLVINPQGEIVSLNALPMLRIWRNSAFPLTSEREKELWEKETWSLELLVDGIDTTIIKWRREGKYICLYGGVDIEWIREFTTTESYNANTKIPIKKVYVGQSSGPEQVQQILGTITMENLSHCLPDMAHIRLFWNRLENMWLSRMQLGKSEDNDEIMAEISMLRSLDQRKKGGWAMMFTGSTDEITKIEKTTILTSPETEIVPWKEATKEETRFVEIRMLSATSELRNMVEDEGFVPTSTHDHVHIPSEGTMEDGKMICAECGLPMEKYVVYSCFIDDD